MTYKETAEKIRDLYNKSPRFPTLEEVEKVLIAAFGQASPGPGKGDLEDLLIKHAKDIVGNFGIINAIDALRVLDVKLMDSDARDILKVCADYLYRKAKDDGSPMSDRIIKAGVTVISLGVTKTSVP